MDGFAGEACEIKCNGVLQGGRCKTSCSSGYSIDARDRVCVKGSGYKTWTGGSNLGNSNSGSGSNSGGSNSGNSNNGGSNGGNTNSSKEPNGCTKSKPFLKNGRCSKTCPSNKYYKDTKNICSFCHWKCKSKGCKTGEKKSDCDINRNNRIKAPYYFCHNDNRPKNCKGEPND